MNRSLAIQQITMPAPRVSSGYQRQAIGGAERLVAQAFVGAVAEDVTAATMIHTLQTIQRVLLTAEHLIQSDSGLSPETVTTLQTARSNYVAASLTINEMVQAHVANIVRLQPVEEPPFRRNFLDDWADILRSL